MKSVHVIISIITISTVLIISFFPVTISEPYNITESYEENYTVVEPREVQVADWLKQDIVVNQSFEDTRYIQKDLSYDFSQGECLTQLRFEDANLVLPEWGKFFTISYAGNKYFAGFKNGYFFNGDTYTFDVSSNNGHIYKVLQNDKINVTLKQGEYLTLASGYRIQVNSLDNNKESSTTNCYGSSEYGNEGQCTTTTEYYTGGTISLTDFNVLEKWDVRSGTTVTYKTALAGGENLPMIVVHVGNVTNYTVQFDAIFQLSKDFVVVPGGLGSQIAVNIANTDKQPGVFTVYTGFILNSTLGFEIGRLNQATLNPSESKTLYYTTNKSIETCKSYIRSTSKVAIPENFTNYKDVNFTKMNTQYRNVTQYVDVTKKRLVEKNVTKFRIKIVYGLYSIFK